ncbi:hypothetical protein BJY04DRAFT_211857 [Aspergillus karnatakaensis]|uniref:uncharacterized protein n=1 Tax=Aspergillus karnatakaensis TaxID=1810916 RepID=UPI003CCE28DE
MLTCDHPGCTAQYRRKEHLTRHARKHYPTAPRLTCTECSKTFDRTDSLRRHQQLHRREQGQGQAGSLFPRTSKACDQCHASKTRCDGRDPCNVCSRRGIACRYDRESKRVLPGDTPMQIEANKPAEPTPVQRGDPIHDLILQHENDLRERGLLMSPEIVRATTQQSESEPGGSDIDLDYHVEVYFDHFHYQWPMLHSHSFRLSKEPQILLLAVVMIGLWVTGDGAARSRAENMHEKLLALLENQTDTWRLNSAFANKAWPMTTYQTIVLNIIFAVIREASQNIISRCTHLLRALTTTCLTGGLFSYRRMRAQIEPTDSLVFTWTYLEEVKRLALTIFKLNMHFNTGMLSPSDLQFPLPGNGYLWDAPRSKEFYRRYHAQLESGTFMDSGPLVSDIIRDVRNGGKGIGLLMEADPWLGLLSYALKMALSHLLQPPKADAHGRCHHHHHTEREWLSEMESWNQLESLRHMLCQRDPDLPFSEELLEQIDAVITHKNSHALLTSTTSIPPSLVVNHTNNRRTNISLWKGDITTLTHITAIVNAANSALLGCFQPSHKCIDNVIHSAAGPRLRQACSKLMRAQGYEEPVGRAKVTPGFNLPAPYVIHTVGPQLRANQHPGPKDRTQLKNCYISCLRAAETLPPQPDGRKVLAIPCISTGLFAFPPDLAACIAVETVVQYLFQNPHTTLTDIIFNTFLQRDFTLYESKISSLPLDDLCTKVTKASLSSLSISSPPLPLPTTSLKTAQTWLGKADYLLITAGAGLSAATGLDYTSPSIFQTHFPAFRSLGLEKLYDVFGFKGWNSDAQKWGYYAAHLDMVRTWPLSPLYAQLRHVASQFGERCFVRTSNADGFFVKNGFDIERISTPQGNYDYLQCLRRCRADAVFSSWGFVDAAMPFIHPETQELMDESLIPACRFCGGEVTLCVRGGSYFNEAPFEQMERAYELFLEEIFSDMETRRKTGGVPVRAVVLELGVGLNTPSVLRWANEELVESLQGHAGGEVRLIRAGIDAAGCAPWEMEEDGVAVGIMGELGGVVGLLAEGL